MKKKGNHIKAVLFPPLSSHKKIEIRLLCKDVPCFISLCLEKKLLIGHVYFFLTFLLLSLSVLTENHAAGSLGHFPRTTLPLCPWRGG